MIAINYWLNYFHYRKWLLEDNLESSALTLLDFALHKNKEHDFLDFKQDFFTERAFQKRQDKPHTEGPTKEAISYLLERYCVAFANARGGFLIVGIAETNKGFKLHGVNYKNLKRKKLIAFLKQEKQRIRNELGITLDFVSLTINSKEVFIFKISEGDRKPYLNSNGKQLIRIKDETLDITQKTK